MTTVVEFGLTKVPTRMSTRSISARYFSGPVTNPLKGTRHLPPTHPPTHPLGKDYNIQKDSQVNHRSGVHLCHCPYVSLVKVRNGPETVPIDNGGFGHGETMRPDLLQAYSCFRWKSGMSEDGVNLGHVSQSRMRSASYWDSRRRQAHIFTQPNSRLAPLLRDDTDAQTCWRGRTF